MWNFVKNKPLPILTFKFWENGVPNPRRKRLDTFEMRNIFTPVVDKAATSKNGVDGAIWYIQATKYNDV